MRTSGPVLFGKPGLREALLTGSTAQVREAIFDQLLGDPRSSRLQLRRAALEAALVQPLILSEPTPATMSQECSTLAPVEMTCAIPFEGAAWLLDWAAPLWPLPHQVRGERRDGELILTAGAWRGDAAWLPAVLGGELREIERIVASQTMLVLLHNRDLHEQVRALVGRVHPRTSRLALAELGSAQAIVEDDGPLARVMATVVGQMKLALWQEWTR